jgi:hypothetical protein
MDIGKTRKDESGLAGYCPPNAIGILLRTCACIVSWIVVAEYLATGWDETAS